MARTTPSQGAIPSWGQLPAPEAFQAPLYDPNVDEESVYRCCGDQGPSRTMYVEAERTERHQGTDDAMDIEEAAMAFNNPNTDTEVLETGSLNHFAAGPATIDDATSSDDDDFCRTLSEGGSPHSWDGMQGGRLHLIQCCSATRKREFTNLQPWEHLMHCPPHRLYALFWMNHQHCDAPENVVRAMHDSDAFIILRVLVPLQGHPWRPL